MSEHDNFFILKQELKELENKYLEKKEIEQKLWQIELELETGIGSTTLFRELMRTKHALDHQLDRLEEIRHEDIQKIKSSLFSSLITRFPEMKERLKQALDKLSTHESIKSFFESIEIQLSLIEPILTEIEVQRVRACSLLSFFYYIFGKSPTAQITINLDKLSKIAKALHSLITKELNLPEPFTDDLETFTNDILKHTEERWGFSSLKKCLKEIHLVLQKTKDQVKTERKKNQNEIIDIEKTLQEWLER